MNQIKDENAEETVEETQEEEVIEMEGESEEADESDTQEADDIDWEARAIKAEKLIEKNKDKVKKAKESKKEQSGDSVSDVILARLETRGVMETEDQDYVLRVAKLDGVSPIEALKDPVVQDRLKANEKARRSENANPTANNRGRGAQDEVDIAVKKFKKDGTLPDNNPSLTVKILKKLKQE